MENFRRFRSCQSLALMVSAFLILAGASKLLAQESLTGTNYTQNFNGLGTATPANWSGRTGANTTALGTAQTVGTAHVLWNNTSGAFKNFGAYITGATGENDAANTNRAMGLRPTGSFGDLGGSFNFYFNSTGLTVTGLSIDLMLLDAQTRSTTYSLQVASGASPTSWTTLDTWADPGVVGITTKSFSASVLSDISDKANVWFRVVALSASTGSGSRDTVAIDNFSLTYSASTPPLLWDLNGTDVGAGGTTPAGTWGSGAFWSSTSDGTGATSPWTAGGDAVFSAGTDAIGAFTVNLDDVQSVGSLTFAEGTVTLGGTGGLTMSDATPAIVVDATSAVIDVPVAGANGLNKSGLGTLTLVGLNTFAGSVVIGAGTLSIAADTALGNADNDLTLNGTLKTTTTFDLPATRDFLGGSGSLAPATGTVLGVLGNVTLSGLTLSDVGTVALQGTTRSVGALSFTAAGTLNAPGTVTATGLTATGLTSGTATINPVLDLGTSTTDVTVDVGTGGTVRLASTLAKGSGAAGRAIKTGAGTLRLDGANTELYGMTIGATGAVPTNGGTVEISTKDSLGTGATGDVKAQLRHNYGTLSATTALTGANAIPNGLSIGARDASPAVFSGSSMEFAGAVAIFGTTTGTSGDIRFNVNNNTTFTGSVTAATNLSSNFVTGLAIGGTGKLTLSGPLTALTTNLKLKDSVTVELNSATLGASAAAAPTLTMDAGTKLAVGTVGTTTSVTAYGGLNGASTSVLQFDIGGTTAGTGYDKLILAKPTADAGPLVFAFAGKIDVDVINSFAFTVGDSFDLLDWDAGVTPDFAGIDFTLLPAPGAGRRWDTNQFATNGTLSIVATSVDFSITTHPQSQTVNPGAQVTFSVVASGTGLTYQWRKGLTNIDGATNNTLVINPVSEADQGSYFVDISNTSGTLASNEAVLTVNDPVMITGEPAPTTTVNQGTPFTLTVTATGTGLTYQWRKGLVNIDGATAASYTNNNPTVDDSGTYSVVVTGTVSSATSANAAVTVNPTPISITTPPQSQTAFSGQAVTFTVVAAGTSPTYQWRKGTVNIDGATAASYTINAVSAGDQGTYDVVVTGPGVGNTQTSDPATLTVITITPGTSITSNQTYFEDFNTMGTSNAANVAQYPASWTGLKAAGNTTPPVGSVITSAGTSGQRLTTGIGDSNSGAIYNFGSTGNADRALGSLASSSFAAAYGVTFTNDTGIELVGAQLKIGFRSELWRSGSAAGTDTYVFEWKVGGNITDLDGWSPASAFDITELNAALTDNAAKDGNATGNNATLAPTALSTLSSWPAGAVLHLRWRDADNAGSDSGMAVDDFIFQVSNVTPPAPVVYWDKDGVTPGAGGVAPVGTWGVDAFWSSDATGATATVGWDANSDAVFSAGSDATGLFTVTVDGSQSVGGLKFEDGTVTLSGGTIEFSDFIPTLAVDATEATIASVISGTSGLLKQGPGKLVLAGTNLFSGNVTIGAGSVSIAADSGLGNTANDLIFSGTLVTTNSLELGVGRSLSGNIGLAPAAGTTLSIAGSLSASAFSLADTGAVNVTGGAASLGTLTFSAAGSITGTSFTVGDIVASHVGGSSQVNGAVNLGATNRNATVSDATSTLTLVDPVTLTGGGSNRLTKLGAGTLVLLGANTALNKVALGLQSTASGGKLVITNKDALGTTQMFFNYGTLEASSDLSGANAMTTMGLSIGGLDGAEAVLTGQPMTFGGATTLFGSGEIDLIVNNRTTIAGVFTSGSATGLAISGSGAFSLAGDLTGFVKAMRSLGTVDVELDTATVGSAAISASGLIMNLSVGEQSSLVIGQEGTTRGVIAYAGLVTSSESEVVFDIGGTTRGASTGGYDALTLVKANNGTNDIAGAVTFAGKVRVEFTGGFTPVAGQTFDLLDWDAAAVTNFTGASFDLPALPPGLSWFTDTFTTDGTIAIANAQVNITAQPQNQSGAPGFTATFSVTATGLGPLQYQWRKGTTNLQGQNARTLTISNAQLADEGSYSVVVTGGGTNNTATSAPATLTITGPVRGVIASRTGTEPVYVGDPITFSVAVVGDGPFTYQWIKDGTPINLATNSSLVIASSVTSDTGSYTVAVTSGATTITSNAVVLTVLPIVPNIVDEPDSAMLTLSAPMTLTVVATGKPPLRYQWQKNGVNIAKATAASYTVTALALTDYGAYRCVVSSGTGTGILSDTSATAQIGVVSAVEKKLVVADKTATTMIVSAAANGLSYAWKKNGGSLPADVRITGGTKNSLVITNLKSTDTADYTCVLTSLAGTRTAGLHDLTVFDKAPLILKPVVFPAAIVSGQFDDSNVGGPPGFQIPYDAATDRTPTSFSAPGLPSGLICSPTTGLITGKPLATKVGGYLVTMKATNLRGTDTATAILNVADLPAQTAGEYDGMVERSPTMNTNMGGRIDLTISATGAFTGSVTSPNLLTLGSQVTYPLTGALDVDVGGVLPSTGTITITKNSLGKVVTPAIVITFTVNPTTNRLTGGTITQGVNAVAFTAWRNVWLESTNLALNKPATAYEGLYNLGLEYVTQPAPGSTTVPMGTGYVTFKAPKSKVFAITGKTADNEAISCSTFLGPDGEVLMFRSLYLTTIKGSLLGTMKILTGTLPLDPNDNVIDDTALLTWNRPQNTALTARTYAAGFATLGLKPVGGVYVPPVAPKVLFGRDPGATAQVTFAEAGLGLATRNPNMMVTIGALSKVTYPLAANNLAKTVFTALTPATGLFSGTFELSDPNPRLAPNNLPLTVVRSQVPFFGIVIREASGLSGVGSFLLPQLPSDALNTKTTTSPILSGQVLITP